MVYGKPGFKVYKDIGFLGVLVSRYARICGLWDTWFQIVYQDMWFMEHLASRYARICGLWETLFPGIPGYWVYGRAGCKVFQDMWFM